MSSVYFLSDFHLGIPNAQASREREKALVRFLDTKLHDAEALFLMGDVFDFWFEWRSVVPKGHVRLLGALAELADGGLPIHYFTGNHDMWTFGYLEQELGVQLHRKPQTVTLQGKTLHIGHGDGLGPGDHGYKFIKQVFASPACQWLLARLHPNASMAMANFFSGSSRKLVHQKESEFFGEDEWLVKYCRQVLQKEAIDWFVFGHRHLPLVYPLSPKSHYINLGEWINHQTYARLHEGHMELLNFR